MPPAHYTSISQHLSRAFNSGAFLKDGPPKGDAPAAPPNPLTDPGAMEGMMGGMKTQMVMMVPQMVIMGWINFFFQGFVLSTSLSSSASVTRLTLVKISQAPFSAYAGFQVYASARY